MAEVQQTQVLPAPFIQAAAETYLPQLAEAVGGIKGLDVSKLYGHNLLQDLLQDNYKQNN
jgi:hypothetical protein